MKKRITASTILLASSLWCASVVWSQTSSQPADPKRASASQQASSAPLLGGFDLGLDLFGLGSRLFGSDFLSSEISLSANFRNRYYPVVEVGYGHTDTTDDTYDIHYKGSGFYGRVGMDYNVLPKKMDIGYLTVGLRYGLAPLSFDVSSPDLTDPVWGGNVPFHYEGMRTTAHWMEIVGGIHVAVTKHFHMGWSLRYRIRMRVNDFAHATPWYIPGYGSNRSKNLGVTYNLIYHLPF